MYDLSFWERPDWQRESTINPTFLMTVAIALCLLIGFAAVSMSYQSLASVKEDLKSAKAGSQGLTAKAQRLKELQKQSNTWEKKLEKLETEKNRKIVISRQLEALQKLVPDDIILDSLNLNLKTIEEKIKKGNAKKVKINFQYEMTLSGVAGGKMPQAVITEFAGKLRPGAPNPIGERLKSSELKQISGGSRGQEDAKTFDIACIYLAK